jgi:hypothetical protein
MLGFGIDLAGYTTGKTCVAAIEANGSVAEATLLRGSHLTAKRSTDLQAIDVIRDDIECLRRCLALGPVAVDIPVDLQDLSNHSKFSTIWAMTLRPVGRKLHAMAPLADRIGAPVARFKAIMEVGHFEDALGASLFETYPAGTLKLLKFKGDKYKSKSKHDKNARDAACIALCDELKLQSHNENIKNDDDIDAIICAVAAVAPAQYICVKSDLDLCTGELPRGYRILKNWPFEAIRVTPEAKFDRWLSDRESRK